jgi:hypothetical protein
MKSSLIIPPSLKNIAKRISIDPTPNSKPNPPAWMLKYFPHFFVKEKGSDKPPHGIIGVYAYLTSFALAAGLSIAHIYERFFTDSIQKANALIKEKMLQEEEKEINV